MLILGKEILFSTNQVASRVLDLLVGFTSGQNFEMVANAISSDYRVLCSDRFASFVIEGLAKIAVIRSLSNNVAENITESDSDSEELTEPIAKKKRVVKLSSDIEFNLSNPITPSHKKFCQDFLVRTSKFLLNNLEDLLFDNFSNHVMRTCLLCLSGLISVPASDGKNVEIINLKEKHGKEIPVEWIEIVKDYAQRLKMWPQFPDLPYSEESSCILQTLYQSLKNFQEDKVLKDLTKTILKGFSEELNENKTESSDVAAETLSEFPKIFRSNSTLHLLEAMVQNCGEKYLLKLYEEFFKGRLVKLSEAKNLNFSVQKLVDSVLDKSLFEAIYDEISPSMKELLQVGHTGVVLSLAKACHKLAAKQGQFTQALLKSINCAGDKSNKCLLPILKLKPLEIAENESFQINLHGSIILQEIFQFNKPIKFVQCFLEMKTQDLSTILQDPKGSRLADAFLQSKFIGEKNRDKLIKKMEGMYLQLANSKHGSRVLEKFFEVGNDLQKEAIVTELSDRVNQLMGTQSGRIIHQKLSVEIFSRNRGQWKSQYIGKS